MQQFKVPKTDWRLNIPALLTDWFEKLSRFMDAMFSTDKQVKDKPKTSLKNRTQWYFNMFSRGQLKKKNPEGTVCSVYDLIIRR